MNASPLQGLTYIEEFITPEEEKVFLALIDQSPWLTDLRRRVQHYGYRYDYKARAIDHTMRLGPLPDWSQEVVRRLQERRLVPEPPDQLIINEYEPGQGIAAHVDCVPCFTDTIVSISLGSACVMDFKNAETRQSIPLLVQPRSLIVMSDEARYDWLHGIAGRKTDVHEGQYIERRRRVSLTFRKVILENETA